MPRKSAEERAASLRRAGPRVARPPKSLSPPARRIWREIVASKPGDWFDAGQLGLLALHVETMARANEVQARLATMDVTSPEFDRLSKTLRVLLGSVATSARQLRLTAIATIDRAGRDGRIDERGPGLEAAEDDLIGGTAAWRRRRLRAVE